MNELGIDKYKWQLLSNNNIWIHWNWCKVWSLSGGVHWMFGGCSVDNHWTSLSSHCPLNVHWSPVDNVGDCEILQRPYLILLGPPARWVTLVTLLFPNILLWDLLLVWLSPTYSCPYRYSTEDFWHPGWSGIYTWILPPSVDPVNHPTSKLDTAIRISNFLSNLLHIIAGSVISNVWGAQLKPHWKESVSQ